MDIVGEDVGNTLPAQLPDASSDHGDVESEANMSWDTSTDPTLTGLREISTLASWTVSTHKPLCGTTALLTPNPTTFWQSDGPQPHLLTLSFQRTVTVLRFRIFLDFDQDESYTPTRMEFWAGVHGTDYGLVQWGAWAGEKPKGWQDISVEGQGPRGTDGVVCRVLQVRVCENHQNGKDTHVRGCQVFARDERIKRPSGGDREEDAEDRKGKGKGSGRVPEFVGDEPDWMADPEIR